MNQKIYYNSMFVATKPFVVAANYIFHFKFFKRNIGTNWLSKSLSGKEVQKVSEFQKMYVKYQ